MNRIARFAFWGAVGFGIGGYTGGAITGGLNPFLDSAILGIFGGASLGFVSKGWNGPI